MKENVLRIAVAFAFGTVVATAGAQALPPPVLDSPINPDTDGMYVLSWSAVPGADNYEIFEFDNNPHTWASGTFRQLHAWSAATNISITKTNNGTWYYRIRTWSRTSTGGYTNGALSSQLVTQIVQITVSDLPKPPPVMNSPVNPDTDGTYTLSWSAIPGADNYELFEFDNNPHTWASGTFRQLHAWSAATNISITKTNNGTWYYRIRTWSRTSTGGYTNGALSSQLVTQVVVKTFTVAQISNLNRYASATVRYFTSTQANNKAGGFTHAQFGLGRGRVGGAETPMYRETGSHANINEVTLRFLSLAAADKMGWLGHVPAASRYAESWGQIRTGLETLRQMQTSGNTNRFHAEKTFYRGYWTTWGFVNDYAQSQIQWDQRNLRSSDDNGLPFMNLLMLQGMAVDLCTNPTDRAVITNLCHQIRNTINLRRFVDSQYRIVHEYSNNVPSSHAWDRTGAEGAAIAAAMLLTTNQPLTRGEFDLVAARMQKTGVSWLLYGSGATVVTQASYHGAMFIHGLRSLHGLPVTTNEFPGARFYEQSLLPLFTAHEDFALFYGHSALGSQPMTQRLDGYPIFQGSDGSQIRYPGNEGGVRMVPGQLFGVGAMARMTAPHAWFIPLSRPYRLAPAQIDRLFQWMAGYEATFFHGGANAHDDLGWEAVIPWKPADTAYTWVDSTGRRNYTDNGRPYEALNSAYTVLHIFDALNPDKPLAMYSVEKTRAGHIAAFFDSGTPLPPSLFP